MKTREFSQARMEAVVVEGWEGGEPVRAVLSAPDRSQSQAAERVTLQLRGVLHGLVLHQMPAALAHPATPARPGVGAAVWDGALALIDYLAASAPPSSPSHPYAGVTALELGCGPGAVGLALAALGAAVALTDLPAALRLASGNAARNWMSPGRPRPSSPSSVGGCAVALPLEWGGPAWRAQAEAAVAAVTASAGLKSGAGGVDLVVSSDVAYPAPPGGGAEPDPVAWAEAVGAALGGEGLCVFSFERRGEGADADRLRGGLLKAAEVVLGSAPVRVGGVAGSPWRAPAVEVFEVVVGGGGRVVAERERRRAAAGLSRPGTG